MSPVRVTLYALFLNTRGDKALVLQLKVVSEVRQTSSSQGVGGFPQSAPHVRLIRAYLFLSFCFQGVLSPRSLCMPHVDACQTLQHLHCNVAEVK